MVEAGDPDLFPASYGQARLWFLQQLEPGNAFYNIPFALRLAGDLDIEALTTALTALVERHEPLRTTFRFVDGKLLQVIHPPHPFLLEHREVLEGQGPEEKVRAIAREEGLRPFDLDAGPLFRACLIHIAEGNSLLTLTLHHSIADGWSLEVLCRDLCALYDRAVGETTAELPELPIQYADYALWQREMVESGALDARIAYWRERLAGITDCASALPTDRPAPTHRTYEGAQITVPLSPSLVRALEELGKSEGATFFMVLVTAWQILLSRYTGVDDVAVGTPVAGRTRSEIEPLVGFFVNTLVLRTDLSGDPTVRQLLRQVRGVCLDAFENGEVPFDKMVEVARAPRNPSGSPLVQVIVGTDNGPVNPMRLGGVRAEPTLLDGETSKFDVSLYARPQSDTVVLVFDYSVELFEHETVERIVSELVRILEGVSAHPNVPLSSIATDRKVASPTAPSPGTMEADLGCVQDLFEAAVAKAPDRVAAVCGSDRVTYDELNRRANRLARRLRSLGIGPEAIVGLWLERSIDCVVGMLGILKAGGAYLPLDPSHPPERLAFMLHDAGATVLVTERILYETGAVEHDGAVVFMDSAESDLGDLSDVNMDTEATAETLAYVIYTSGSTGRPKGVQIEHRNVVNLLQFGRKRCPHIDGVWAVFHSFAFDFSVWEVFAPLTAGGTIIIVPYRTARSPLELDAFLREHEVAVLCQTPTAFRSITASLSGRGQPADPLPVQHLIFGGEALDASHLENARAAGFAGRAWNMYGITEVTVHATVFQLDLLDPPAGPIPLGEPLGGMHVQVLDESLQAVPPGVEGEIYVGGTGVARGYLNRSQLTAERFIKAPDGSGGRLYRSGDLGRYDDDGLLYYAGRADDQVKIRGYRIELGEIEASLVEHPSVRETAVVTRTSPRGDIYLEAYVVPHQNDVDEAQLRHFLQARLPDYMVPRAIQQLDSLPLTANGKLDRASLPPTGTQPAVSGSARGPAFTPTEERMIEVWAHVLNGQVVRPQDNFFKLGGHSLQAAYVVGRVRDLFGVDLPLAAIFENPTLRELSARVASMDPQTALPESVPMPLEIVAGLPHRLPLYWVQGGRFCCEMGPYLDGDQPFFALPLAHHVGEEKRLTMDAMVAFQIEILRRHRPHGPYLLAGYCQAALVAFEVARRLMEEGEEVPLLVLADAMALTVRSFRLTYAAVHGAGRLLRLSPAHELAIVGLMRDVKHGVANTMRGRPRLERAPDHWADRYAWATAGFRPLPYAGRIALLKASSHSAKRDPLLGWGTVASVVDAYTLPATHHGMLNDNLPLLGAAVQRAIDRVRDCEPASADRS